MADAPTADPGRDVSRIVNHVLVPTAGAYEIDPMHTFIGFSAQHLIVGRVRGRFEGVTGTVAIADEPTDSRLDVTVEAASISTLLAARDDDLRSERFLDVDAHQTMTYRSTDVIERPRGEWNVLGELTVRGVTLPVPLTVHFGGSIVDSSGKFRAAFHAAGTITRSAFGVVAELGTEAGSMMIGEHQHQHRS